MNYEQKILNVKAHLSQLTKVPDNLEDLVKDLAHTMVLADLKMPARDGRSTGDIVHTNLDAIFSVNSLVKIKPVLISLNLTQGLKMYDGFDVEDVMAWLDKVKERCRKTKYITVDTTAGKISYHDFWWHFMMFMLALCGVATPL